MIYTYGAGNMTNFVKSLCPSGLRGEPYTDRIPKFFTGQIYKIENFL